MVKIFDLLKFLKTQKKIFFYFVYIFYYLTIILLLFICEDSVNILTFFLYIYDNIICKYKRRLRLKILTCF